MHPLSGFRINFARQVINYPTHFAGPLFNVRPTNTNCPKCGIRYSWLVFISIILCCLYFIHVAQQMTACATNDFLFMDENKWGTTYTKHYTAKLLRTNIHLNLRETERNEERSPTIHELIAMCHVTHRADSRFAPSQWETSLQNNAVSHWLGVNV